MLSSITLQSSTSRKSAPWASIRQISAIDVDSRHSMHDTAAKAIESFVVGLECDLRRFPVPEDPKLIDAAHNACLQHIPSEEHRRKAIPLLSVALLCATQVYPTLPFEVRLLITVYTAMFAYIDAYDDDDFIRNLDQFAMNFSRGAAQPDPCLKYLAHLVAVEVPKLWGPFASSCIVKATMDMVAGAILEKRFPSGFEHLAQNFPAFLRRKSGDSEAYVLFNFPESLFPESEYLGLYIHSLPGAIEISDFTNDIMSHCKESIVGNEKNTYIVSEARRQNCSSAEVLDQTCQSTWAMHQHLHQKLAVADERVLQAYCSFVDGMAGYHIVDPRYRLGEMGLAIRDGILLMEPQ
ncbi:terpene cyclase [Aspergillus melleus]|uniref:Terpene cyclase n=1 Tax=Aspergillus melleus TaxID=138277 RepID=A0ACC3B7B7_9EURO|nr:terpene cyclase [Aspergillus melleus]